MKAISKVIDKLFAIVGKMIISYIIVSGVIGMIMRPTGRRYSKTSKYDSILEMRKKNILKKEEPDE